MNTKQELQDLKDNNKKVEQNGLTQYDERLAQRNIALQKKESLTKEILRLKEIYRTSSALLEKQNQQKRAEAAIIAEWASSVKKRAHIKKIRFQALIPPSAL